jgi:hypothetical protein
MEEAKVQFSPAEMELICNKEIILTKNRVIEKIKYLLQQLQDSMLLYRKINAAVLQNEVFNSNPKISRGENYLGLPYLVLDYPRCFQQKNIFTIRTMFWWGNFYSTTLHIAGSFKDEYIAKIEQAYNLLIQENYYVGINTEPWEHDFGEDNYKKISLLSREEFIKICEKHVHIKIATNITINNAFVHKNLIKNWEDFMKICFY